MRIRLYVFDFILRQKDILSGRLCRLFLGAQLSQNCSIMPGKITYRLESKNTIVTLEPKRCTNATAPH